MENTEEDSWSGELEGFVYIPGSWKIENNIDYIKR